jgi:tetratricopeptide (TPR) repeat protein
MAGALRHMVLAIAVLTPLVAYPAPAQTSGSGRAYFVRRDDEQVARGVVWARAALRHRPGSDDADVAAIASWTPQATGDVRVEISVILDIMRDERASVFEMPDAGPRLPDQIAYTGKQVTTLRAAARDAVSAGLDADDLLARGLVLETDVVTVGGGQGLVMHFSDSRGLGIQRGGDHWALARRLASWLEKSRARRADVRLWYRAILSGAAAADRWYEPNAVAAEALRPPDADVLFLAACVHETFASPRLQAAAAGAHAPSGVTMDVRSAKDELSDAASLLKRALDLTPGHVDARIHYGRVLTLQDHAADAVAQLKRAATAATTPVQRYYARLFLGDALEATNQREEARAAYTEAAALFPRAQSPRLALSELAARYGDRDIVAEAMTSVVARPDEETEQDDPWWSYARSSGRDSEAMMEEARERLMTRHGAR